MYGDYEFYSSNPYAAREGAMASRGLFDGMFGGFLAGLSVSMIVVGIIIALIPLIGMWKVFKKANYNGWDCLIPGHNSVVLLEIAGFKSYYYFLLLIPFVNIVIAIWREIELAKSFGKGVGFGLGLFFLPIIFYPILGFDSSKYIGPQKDNTNTVNVNSSTNN